MEFLRGEIRGEERCKELRMSALPRLLHLKFSPTIVDFSIRKSSLSKYSYSKYSISIVSV